MRFTLAYLKPQKYILSKFSLNVEDSTLSEINLDKNEFYIIGMYNDHAAYSNGYLRAVFLDETIDSESGTVYPAGYYFFEETDVYDLSNEKIYTYDEIMGGNN